MPTSLRLAGITAATAALTLLAAPAFASPLKIDTSGAATTTTTTVTTTSATSAATPAVKITPKHLALHQYAKSGIVAHLTGFPGDALVAFGLGDGGSGGPIGDSKPHTTHSDGTLNFRYVPPAGTAAANTYTFTVFYTAVAADAGTSSTNPSSTGTSSTDPSSTDPSSTDPSSTDPSSTDPSSTSTSGPAAPTTGTPEQVAVTYTVKPLDAKVAWSTPVRAASSITLKSTVTRWSTKTHRYVAWKNASVKFQEKLAGVWKTKTTVTTDAKGVAAKTVSAKVHTWRALVVGTKTTWGVSSQAHKK